MLKRKISQKISSFGEFISFYNKYIYVYYFFPILVFRFTKLITHKHTFFFQKESGSNNNRAICNKSRFMTSDKFIGYLVSVECKNVFYQGIVTNIDSNKAVIQLKNCFQNGLHCGNKLIDIK